MQSHAVHKLWQSLSGRLKTLQGLALVIQLKNGHAYACRLRHAQPPAMPRLRHSFIWASAVAQQEHARGELCCRMMCSMGMGYQDLHTCHHFCSCTAPCNYPAPLPRCFFLCRADH